LAEEIRDAFAQLGLNAEVRMIDSPDVAAAVQKQAARRPEAIIVGGGDGTISTAAGVLVDTDIPLGILPLGTLNHFAKDLGLPTQWRDCVPFLASTHRQRVDVGEVNGRVFLNTCSLGGYAAAVRRREWLRRRAGHGKWKAMFWGVLATLRRVRRIRVRLETADWRANLRASFVLVANNRYQDDVLVSGRRVQLTEGQLWVYSSPAYRWRDLLWLAFELWRHGIAEATQLDARPTPTLTLSGLRSPVHAALDGEIVPLLLPLRFRVRPRSLLVLTPPEPIPAVS
jgi:diacylglycerol kinase family enzyme